MKDPEIKVGVLSKEEIAFELQGIYSDYQKQQYEGAYVAKIVRGRIQLIHDGISQVVESGFKLRPLDSESGQFKLIDVVIGINFHWERKENQVFKGGIQLLIEDNNLTAVNFLSVEEYLASVISSEMSATSSVELLKAHSVISRSWLLAQIEKNKSLQTVKKRYSSSFVSENEIVKWWDREDHMNYDVCADDHCQRYQGITRETTPIVAEAVNFTRGEILDYQGSICDARYSKCCGGVTEIFENAWEPVNHPYLQKLVDNPSNPEGYNLNLEDEVTATLWIKGNPEAFCNTSDKQVLSQVLNNYDQETNDFFRWKVSYSQEEISELIRNRTSIDFGLIQDLIPIQRGTSGRLIKLKIVGSLRTMTVGKELEIRKALSTTHLYSSAFIIEKVNMDGGTYFILKGAGWGHGVGLCQIGAAVMGSKGYSYYQILMHYFRGATLKKLY